MSEEHETLIDRGRQAAKPDGPRDDVHLKATVASQEGSAVSAEIARSSSAQEAVGRALDVPLAKGDVAGEYIVEETIGAGAFGTVYRGVHPLIGKPAAIKVLSLKHSADREIVTRFVDEARAVNKIGHEGIIDIFGFGQLADGRHYYVMELLDGMTLHALLEEKGHLPPKEALAILGPVARALDAAHAAGIAHRDVKPANIFLEREAERFKPKLLDFGVAKLMGEQKPGHQTASGATVGTPAYMSPEQCVGKRVDHRADIYAFGVVAFEILTGSLPFIRETAFEVMTAHVMDKVPDAHLMEPTLPPAMSQALTKILTKLPDERPATVTAAYSLLEEALSAPAARRPARRVWMAVPVAGLVCVGLVFMGVAVANEREPGPAIVPPSPTPTAPVAVPAASEPVAPPDPMPIQVEIAGIPPEGRVLSLEGTVLRTGPGPISLPRGESQLWLIIDAPGHESERVSVLPTEDRALTVKLKPTRATPREKKPVEKDPVNPHDIDPWK